MNKQQSHTSENPSSIKKAESSRDGFETTPAAAEVDGASGGNVAVGNSFNFCLFDGGRQPHF